MKHVRRNLSAACLSLLASAGLSSCLSQGLHQLGQAVASAEKFLREETFGAGKAQEAGAVELTPEQLFQLHQLLVAQHRARAAEVGLAPDELEHAPPTGEELAELQKVLQLRTGGAGTPGAAGLARAEERPDLAALFALAMALSDGELPLRMLPDGSIVYHDPKAATRPGSQPGTAAPSAPQGFLGQGLSMQAPQPAQSAPFDWGRPVQGAP